jgi:hypothetical protein
VKLSIHAAGFVARIRSDHVYRRVKIGFLRWRRVCSLCHQPAPCNRNVLADDVEAGRRDVAGNPS